MNLKILQLLVYLTFFTTINLSSQVIVSTRIGVSTLNEIQLEVINKNDRKISFYTSIGYAYRSYNFTGPGCGSIWPATIFNKNNKGVTSKLGISIFAPNKKNTPKIKCHNIAGFYRRYNGSIRESEFVNESGCGTSPNFYDYEYTLNDLGLTYINSGDFSKFLSFYWSLSVGQRFRKRENTSSLINGQETEKSIKAIFLVDFGFRLKFD